jgi:ribosomal protein L37AE/L43A
MKGDWFGLWKCSLCGEKGEGGSNGFHEHYVTHHCEVT